MINVKTLNIERTYQNNNTQIRKNNQVRFGDDRDSFKKTNQGQEENTDRENIITRFFTKALERIKTEKDHENFKKDLINVDTAIKEVAENPEINFEVNPFNLYDNIS